LRETAACHPLGDVDDFTVERCSTSAGSLERPLNVAIDASSASLERS
jgi:hypothetical protein